MAISVNSNGFRCGVRSEGFVTQSKDLKGWVNRYDVKEITFNPDSIENKKTLKWNDYDVFREYQNGPKSLTPRFGHMGDFYLTGRVPEQKVLVGKINTAGDIVEIEHLDISAIKEMRYEFPHVERFLKKLSKFMLR